jgi:hypothetical protein
MADRSLEIEIEIAQLKQTVAGLQEAASATVKGTEANVAHGKSVLQMVEHTRGFHKVLHSITEESPLAGLALHAAFSGPGAAVAGLIVAVHALRKAQEEAKKAAEEHAEAATKAFFETNDAVSKAIDAVHQMEVAHKDWAKGVTESGPTIRQDLDQTIAKLHVLEDAQKGVAKAQGRSEAPVARAAEASELAITQAAAERLKRELAQADKEQALATGAAIAGKASAGPIQESIQKQIQKAQEEGIAFDKKHAGEGGPSLMQRLFSSLFGNVPMLRMLSTGGGGSVGPGGEHADEVKRLQNEAAKAAATQAELEKTAAKAQEKFKSLNDQLVEVSKTLDMLKFKAGVGGVGRAMAGEETDPITRTISRGAQALSIQPLIASGRAGPSQLYNESVTALNNLLTLVYGQNNSMLATIKSHSAKFDALAADIERVKADAARKFRSTMTP